MEELPTEFEIRDGHDGLEQITDFLKYKNIKAQNKGNNLTVFIKIEGD